jgi:uncharacterized protein (DUF433 family)
MPETVITMPVPSLVYLDERGIARIEGTQTAVKMIVIDHLTHGYSPAEIHFQYPYLSLAQIHSALAYYYAHQAEMDAEIMQDTREEEAFFSANPNNITREELLRRLGRV